jgi:ankyrin repeat protein
MIGIELAANMLHDVTKPWNIFNTSTFRRHINFTSSRKLSRPIPNTHSNSTLLHLAVVKNNEHIVKLLLTLQVETNVVDYYGHTPLDLAIRENNINIVKLLTSDNTRVTQLNTDLVQETRKRKRVEVDLTTTRKRVRILEGKNKLLRSDNEVLISENRKVVKDRDTYKRRYNTLKEATKK